MEMQQHPGSSYQVHHVQDDMHAVPCVLDTHCTRLALPSAAHHSGLDHKVHDDDVKLFLSSSLPPNSSKNGKLSEAVTFRIPVWLAEKNGFFDGSKSK